MKQLTNDDLFAIAITFSDVGQGLAQTAKSELCGRLLPHAKAMIENQHVRRWGATTKERRHLKRLENRRKILSDLLRLEELTIELGLRPDRRSLASELQKLRAKFERNRITLARLEDLTSNGSDDDADDLAQTALTKAIAAITLGGLVRNRKTKSLEEIEDFPRWFNGMLKGLAKAHNRQLLSGPHHAFVKVNRTMDDKSRRQRVVPAKELKMAWQRYEALGRHERLTESRIVGHQLRLPLSHERREVAEHRIRLELRCGHGSGGTLVRLDYREYESGGTGTELEREVASHQLATSRQTADVEQRLTEIQQYLGALSDQQLIVFQAASLSTLRREAGASLGLSFGHKEAATRLGLNYHAFRRIYTDVKTILRHELTKNHVSNHGKNHAAKLLGVSLVELDELLEPPQIPVRRAEVRSVGEDNPKTSQVSFDQACVCSPAWYYRHLRRYLLTPVFPSILDTQAAITGASPCICGASELRLKSFFPMCGCGANIVYAGPACGCEDCFVEGLCAKADSRTYAIVQEVADVYLPDSKGTSRIDSPHSRLAGLKCNQRSAATELTKKPLTI